MALRNLWQHGSSSKLEMPPASLVNSCSDGHPDIHHMQQAEETFESRIAPLFFRLIYYVSWSAWSFTDSAWLQALAASSPRLCDLSRPATPC